MNPTTQPPSTPEAPPPGTTVDWWALHQDRFVRPCTGRKADPAYDCGYPHDCAGHNNRGGPCGRAPIHGGTVCPLHGGAAPQTLAAARARVNAEADPSLATLVHLRDHGATEQIRYRAAVALAEYAMGRKAAEPADLVEIVKQDPSQLAALERALRTDPELRAAVEKLQEQNP